MRNTLIALMLLAATAPAAADDVYFAKNGEMFHFYTGSSTLGSTDAAAAILIDKHGHRVNCATAGQGDGDVLVTCGKHIETVEASRSGFTFGGLIFAP